MSTMWCPTAKGTLPSPDARRVLDAEMRIETTRRFLPPDETSALEKPPPCLLGPVRRRCPRVLGAQEGRPSSGAQLSTPREHPLSQRTQDEPGPLLLGRPGSGGIWGLVTALLVTAAVCSSSLLHPSRATPGLVASETLVVAFAKIPTLHHNVRHLLLRPGGSPRCLFRVWAPPCQPPCTHLPTRPCRRNPTPSGIRGYGDIISQTAPWKRQCRASCLPPGGRAASPAL